MLSSIASYLFGFSSGDADADSVPSEQNCDDLMAVEAEEDWVLVDKYADKSTTTSDDEDLVISPDIERRLRRRRHQLNRHNVGVPKVAPSLEKLISFDLPDDSWYVTPPPCFVRTDSDTAIKVASSPLEDLLIEHPSMSVYWNKQEKLRMEYMDMDLKIKLDLLAQQRDVVQMGRDIANMRSIGANVQSTGVSNSIQRLKNLGHYYLPAVGTNAYYIKLHSLGFSTIDMCSTEFRFAAEQKAREYVQRAHLELEIKEIKEIERAAVAATNKRTADEKERLLFLIECQTGAQKSRQNQHLKLLHHKQLERRNKVQEFESVGKQKRRKAFMRSPSGKSNNRKY